MSTKPAKKPSAAPAGSVVTRELQNVLKDTYALYLATHNYHWNVEGINFVGLHTLFEQQYTELFAAIDVIAERIRALEAYALPNHYEDVLDALQALPNPLTQKGDRATAMIQNLLVLNKNAAEAAQAAKKAAEKAGDDESVDLCVERITVHQKSMWMLRSIIK